MFICRFGVCQPAGHDAEMAFNGQDGARGATCLAVSIAERLRKPMQSARASIASARQNSSFLTLLPRTLTGAVVPLESTDRVFRSQQRAWAPAAGESEDERGECGEVIQGRRVGS